MNDPTDQPPTELPAATSSSNKPAAVWQDRRGMFQRGKDVHEPGVGVRRLSQNGTGIFEAVRRASTASNGSLVDKPLSNDPAAPMSYPTASESSRRRSSAASAARFGNLTHHKRGSEDYADRRASQSEQLNSGGVVAGWYNSVFKGVKKTENPQTQKPEKRGVME